MFGNAHFDRVRQLFADQFDLDGEKFIYRKNMKGPPIQVTAGERDDFVTAFNRRLRYAAWGIIPATLLLIGLMVFLNPGGASTASQIPLYGGLSLILSIFLGVYWWAWTSPARQLERRPTIGEARSRAEMKKIMLAKMTYGQLGIATLAIGGLLFRVESKNDLLSGWNRLWLVLAAISLAGIAFQAYRKWRFDTTDQ